MGQISRISNITKCYEVVHLHHCSNSHNSIQDLILYIVSVFCILYPNVEIYNTRNNKLILLFEPER